MINQVKTQITETILREIHIKADAAVLDKRDHGGCGFAWVNVVGIRTKADKVALGAVGFRRNQYEKAQQLWVSGYGQSINNKEIYAQVFSSELRKLGYDAYAGSRLD